MVELTYALSILCLLVGSISNLIAGFGIFHFPDVYTRMHAAGITDSFGTGLILIGLMLQTGWDGPIGKLLAILIFTLITSPTISYVLANTALKEQPPKTANTTHKKTDES